MKNVTRLSLVNTKNKSDCQSHRGETLKSCEIVQRWDTELVKYEKRDKLIAFKH